MNNTVMSFLEPLSSLRVFRCWGANTARPLFASACVWDWCKTLAMTEEPGVTICHCGQRSESWWCNILMQASKSISRCHRVLGQTQPLTFFPPLFSQAPGLLGIDSKLPVSLPGVTQGLWIDAGVCSAQSAGHWHVWPMSVRPRCKAPNCRHYTSSTSKLPWKQGRARPTLLSIGCASAADKVSPVFLCKWSTNWICVSCSSFFPNEAVSALTSDLWPSPCARISLPFPLTPSARRHAVSVTGLNGKVRGSVRPLNERGQLFSWTNAQIAVFVLLLHLPLCV